ncbi:hypothetical protein ACFOYW_16565 [Gryllotalpicola reticulitermitis]|uniref:Glutaminase n=1 Tax=Gryllotalpicola reticulitermitis TaxID=1184153 RepID=A0ABV8QBD7_9MICO
MSDSDDSGHGAAGIRDLAASLARELADARARDEALAVFEPARRRLGVTRGERMRAVGRVWRLGALLLSASGELYGTGHVVRAAQPARRSVIALAVAEQRAYQAAAVRGGFPSGETVNFNVTPIDLGQLERTDASGPLVLRDGVAFVRWSPIQLDAVAPLAPYLRDRAALLANPPEGA